MEENWYAKFVQRKFNKELYESKAPFEDSFYNLKATYSYNDICIIADNLDKKFDKYIYGIPFPKELSEFDKTPIIGPTSNIEKETNWFFLSIRAFHDELNEIVNRKIKIEKSILLGNYKEAIKILEETIDNYGISLWSCETRLLIEELENGVDANKSTLNTINSKDNAPGYILSVIDYFSKKAELDFPINRFLNELQNSMDSFPDDAFKLFNIEYYYLRVAPLARRKYKTLNSQLSFDGSLPLIDRYITFLKVIQDFICFHELNENDNSVLRSRLYYLSKKINDPIINKMRVHLDPDLEFDLQEIDHRAVQAIDFYTKGSYDKSSQLLRDILKVDPSHFDLLVLFLKTLINIEEPFEVIVSSDSLLDRISKDVYEVLIRKNNPQVHIRNLTKYSFILSSFPISTQILNFSIQQARNDISLGYLSSLNSSFYNPKICQLYSDRSDCNRYLLNLDQKLRVESPTIRFLMAVSNDDVELESIDVDISGERKAIYSAQYYQQKGNHQRSIELWKQLLNDTVNRHHLQESILAGLYKSYFEIGEVDNCIELFVDTYLKNRYLVTKFDTRVVQDWIRKNRFRDVGISIKLPIFFHLIGANESRVSIALEKYLESYDSKTITSFIEKINGTDPSEKPLLILLLKSVASVEVFKHMVHIKGTKNKILERIAICEYLMEIDEDNIDEYYDEKEELNRQLLLQEGLQEYDESKIYINEKMIRNTQLEDISIDYHRYEQFEDIIKKHPDLKLLIGDTIFNVKSSGGKDDKSEPVFSQDPLFDQFKLIFREIRDKFLFSQYGLGEYLSARIRHGVFKSEIRPKTK